MARPLDSKVLVIDVESTCWEAPEVQGKNEISEIIEIGLVVFDIKTLLVSETDSILIKPQRSKLSKFCTKLTTLTQELVDTGVTYQAAMQILKNKYKSSDRTMISWGDYDRRMFERNCRDYNVQYPFGARHLNLKNCFTMMHGLDREPGMDAALSHIGMELDGTHHRGGDDAKNIANILRHTLGTFRTAT